jgi:hypothetical protein
MRRSISPRTRSNTAFTTSAPSYVGSTCTRNGRFPKGVSTTLTIASATAAASASGGTIDVLTVRIWMCAVQCTNAFRRVFTMPAFKLLSAEAGRPVLGKTSGSACATRSTERGGMWAAKFRSSVSMNALATIA